MGINHLQCYYDKYYFLSKNVKIILDIKGDFHGKRQSNDKYQ